MKILVTGAQGFLGSQLVSMLACENFEVISLTRKNCDLAKKSEVNSFFSHLELDLIIHCAAFVPATLAEYQSESLSRQNSLLLENVLAASCCPVIYISSMTVYGPSKLAKRVESETPAPQSAYAKSKYMGELCLKNSNRDALAIRIPGLFGGTREEGLIYNNLMQLSKGIDITLPETPLMWAAMDVEDAASSIVKIVKNYRFNGFDIINLGYEDNYSINHLVEIYNSLFNCHIFHKIIHPNFQFDLSKIKKLHAFPEADLLCALKKYKSRIC